jgi:hypothetical protein
VQAVDVDPPTHVTLLALTGGDDGTVVGGAQYSGSTTRGQSHQMFFGADYRNWDDIAAWADGIAVSLHVDRDQA